MNTQRPDVTASELVELVTAVPGVRGIEPGISSTLRAIDARLRGAEARHGLVLEPTGSGTATIEIGLDRSRSVRSIVREVQLVLRERLPPGTQIRVRVQSLPR